MNRALPLSLWMAFFLLLLAPLSSSAMSVSEVPMPPDDGWVVDATGVLSAKTIAAVDKVADTVYEAGAGELAVAVISSTGGVNHRAFATDLFNLWGIGDAAKDNGVLIFVAVNDRKAEIILGDGIDRPSKVKASERVMQNNIIAAFKRSDANGAVRSGAEGCAREIFGLAVPSARGTSSSAGKASMSSSNQSTSSGSDPTSLMGALAGLLGLGGAGVGGGLWLKRRRRRKPRICGCGATMTRLSETDDDAHLSRLERAEESLGSVDYDVWLCPACKETLKLEYGAFFTKYKSCPGCGGRTSWETSVVLEHATEHSEGEERRTTQCKHCDYQHSYHHRIPRVVATDTDYGSSSSGFGGGSSSGGGASGSW